MLSLIVAMVLSADNGVKVEEKLSVPEYRCIRRLDGTPATVYCAQVLEGIDTRKGKWVVLQPPGDRYGFTAIWNSYRAAAGLSSLSYDSNLEAWATQNNSAQNSKGLGHHVNPGFRQNAGWNYANAQHVFNGWMGSTGHRALLLSQGLSAFGIAYGPGPYWTLNAK
jgi:hypothetical protein